jgi:hypothetical protein
MCAVHVAIMPIWRLKLRSLLLASVAMASFAATPAFADHLPELNRAGCLTHVFVPFYHAVPEGKVNCPSAPLVTENGGAAVDPLPTHSDPIPSYVEPPVGDDPIIDPPDEDPEDPIDPVDPPEDEDDGNNGHGDEPDHDDDSNPGQGGGNHGTPKPPKPPKNH